MENKDLETAIIQYFLQDKNSVDYLEYGIDSDIFKTVEYADVFSIYKAYVEKYKSIPDLIGMCAILAESGASIEQVDFYKSILEPLYIKSLSKPLAEDYLIKEVKKKMHIIAVQKTLIHLDDKWKEEYVTSLYKDISKIDQLNVHGGGNVVNVFKEWSSITQDPPQVFPTCLANLNRILGRGGFAPPEIITMMGGPKSMKTAFMMNLALGYVRNNVPIAFVDYENKKEPLLERIRWMLNNIRFSKLYDADNIANTDVIAENYRQANAHLQLIILKKRKDTPNMACKAIEKEYLKTDILPKGIFWDYLDIAGYDKTAKSKMDGIQQCYAAVSNINDDFKCWSFTASKMHRDAASKAFVNEQDIGEDYEKVYNANTVLALLRNDQDVEYGIGRVQSIVQRVGISRSEKEEDLALLDMDGETMSIKDSIHKGLPY